MSKDMWIEAHEREIADYLDRHPKARWSEAYERTAERADARAADMLAAQIDEARDRAKYRE